MIGCIRSTINQTVVGGSMKAKVVAAMSLNGISSSALRIIAALVLPMLASVPTPAAAAECPQLVAKYEGSSWWPGAFSKCRLTGTDDEAIFVCAWNQVPAPEKIDCLREGLRKSPITQKYINDIKAFNSPSCEQLFAKYEGSSWWGGAFGNCRKWDGPVLPSDIFACAWSQVPAPENTECLKGKLGTSPSTNANTAAVQAFNRVHTCAELFTKYEGSSWWWGAFGNCKKRGGIVTFSEIFECAWNQVPAPEKIKCLHDGLQSSASTGKAIATVIAYNTSQPPKRLAPNPLHVELSPYYSQGALNTYDYRSFSTELMGYDFGCNKPSVKSVLNTNDDEIRLAYGSAGQAPQDPPISRNSSTLNFSGNCAVSNWSLKGNKMSNQPLSGLGTSRYTYKLDVFWTCSPQCSGM
jgi:hypothetical protein